MRARAQRMFPPELSLSPFCADYECIFNTFQVRARENMIICVCVYTVVDKTYIKSNNFGLKLLLAIVL